MSRIDARVQVVDTEGGRTFTERFDATPIRIGRALDSDLVLPHPAIAARHGEIAIGVRTAHFRSRAWLRASYLDGARIKRGRAVTLTGESVISIGPYEITVWFRARDRRSERERLVTPLVLTVVPSPAARERPDLGKRAIEIHTHLRSQPVAHASHSGQLQPSSVPALPRRPQDDWTLEEKRGAGRTTHRWFPDPGRV